MKSKTSPGEANSGSPPTGEPEYLVVGTVRRPHGLRGEILMAVVTDFPDRLVPEASVYLGERHVAATIASRRPHGQGLIIKFRGIDTQQAAGAYRNQRVYVTAVDRPPLPRGQLYHHQLIGCIVEDESEVNIGALGKILTTGANDVYVINTAVGGELLLPAIPSVILQVDPVRRVIRVRVPDGMGQNSRG